MRFEDDLVLLQLESKTKEEVISKLGNQLQKNAYVTEDFVKSVLQREEHFPTGLPASPYGVAIPHTDPNKVVQSQIAFASLKNPVIFYTMGPVQYKIEVKMVFLLALKKSNEQLNMLQNLTGVLQHENMVKKLGDAKNVEQFKQTIKRMI
ncbi:PTS sugar transporter subunit IIA [Virgibacillus alimentarius]|uniref:PTS system galactitol-specific IIA component n=1 Tax=Virgibacillus alimentarius TaxID=698769 RepID=A0ABS4S8D8_9BACI|nr:MULTISPECIES: PTS sugar transporter subunit IIA [Virgibacillus]MBP2257762.1 PTS system galactitol-specific IIA component [Virgibacillus alimentarius]HLR68652.1 PTS sugar transporter subunit IIA [Virgibacillus sp.]